MSDLSLAAVNVALDRRMASLDRRLVLESLSDQAGEDFTWMWHATGSALVAYRKELVA